MLGSKPVFLSCVAVMALGAVKAANAAEPAPTAKPDSPSFAKLFGQRERVHDIQLSPDGKHVGKVDHVLGTEIELAKLDLGSGFKHHLIPLSWVDFVDEKHVHLTLTADEAKAAWREKH